MQQVDQSALQAAVTARDFARLRLLLVDSEPHDAAAALEELSSDERTVAFRVLPRERAAEIFEYLEADSQKALIKALADERVAEMLNAMAPDERTQLLEEMPAAVTRQALSLLEPIERAVAVKLLGYPEDSIGRLMTPEVLAARRDWTVEQTLAHIRRAGSDVETFNVLYVTDDAGVLVDDLRIRQLIMAEPDSRIEALCDGHVVALKATDDQEEAVGTFREYDRVALPVTDSRGVLLGIVTHDDVLDVAEEEATEDIQKIGGSEALEAPYMRIGFFEMTKKRAVWLIALFGGQLLTLNALALFEVQLQQRVVLSLFIPLIISSGGNSGAQAATLVVRAMALDEVTPGDWWKVLRRELLFGLLLGSVIAVIGFGRVFVADAMGRTFADGWYNVGLVISLSLVSVVVWGVCVGSMLPFVMRRLGADPAASSTPFVTTLVDVTGLVIYLLIAAAIL